MVFQSIQGNVKYHGRAKSNSRWNTTTKKTIVSLGKLAFQQLEKGNLIFYESDLTECGIDVRAASVCSGVFTQIFREERGLYQRQDKDKQNVLEEPPSPSDQSLHSVHRVAVHKDLQSKERPRLLSFLKKNKKNVGKEPPSTSNPSLHSVHRVAVDKALQKEELVVFDLKKYSRSEAGLLKLLPVLEAKAPRRLLLSGCQITQKGCAFLASADLGVKLLSDELSRTTFKLETLRVDGGEFRFKPGFTKYACDLTLDPNTANRNLSLSEENRKVTSRGEKQPYPDHPERFDFLEQVLCREGLTGSRWYWEVERRGVVSIGVTYRGINRRGEGEDCLLGYNIKSWSLFCNDNSYSARHNKKRTLSPVYPSGSTRVGVYLDCPGGTLSFYRVSSDTLTLIHTFHSTFTEPFYPGFRVWWEGSSVSLYQR
ncbi:uncharacterized protein FYW47_017967 [Aplochiton taeniatus]